jgi:Zn finger protein HypA/HybF involved in hydrogenase expression
MVEIRPMTAREEDILTSRALLKKGTVVTELIKSCLVDKSINTLDLVAGDRNALMVAVRITGYGAEYTAEVSCPECEAKSQQTFNLAELPVKRLEIDPVTEGQNLFEFVLPHTKKKVLFKFTTGKDEEELTVIQEKQKKLGLKTDSTVTTALQQAIVSVDGIEDRAKINNFIKAMPARDSLALRNHIRQNEPGLTMKQDMTCPECGHSEEVNMPLGVSFLWPTS